MVSVREANLHRRAGAEGEFCSVPKAGIAAGHSVDSKQPVLTHKGVLPAVVVENVTP
jgi:hypothetical protein